MVLICISMIMSDFEHLFAEFRPEFGAMHLRRADLRRTLGLGAGGR